MIRWKNSDGRQLDHLDSPDETDPSRATTSTVPFAIGVALACVILLGGALTGCSELGRAGAERDEAPQSEPTEAPVRAMPIETRNDVLPEEFPIEVPIANGRVSNAELQESLSGSVWVYELLVDAPVSQVADWYVQAYASANWALARREPGSTDDGSLKLTFRKGRAESLLAVTPSDEVRSAVVALVGLGVPVTDTY